MHFTPPKLRVPPQVAHRLVGQPGKVEVPLAVVGKLLPLHRPTVNAQRLNHAIETSGHFTPLQ